MDWQDLAVGRAAGPVTFRLGEPPEAEGASGASSAAPGAGGQAEGQAGRESGAAGMGGPGLVADLDGSGWALFFAMLANQVSLQELIADRARAVREVSGAGPSN